jgi:transposase-like protein
MNSTRLSPHKLNALTDAEKAKIVDLYLHHDVETRALATRYSVHSSTILTVLREAGVTVKGSSGASRKR